MKKWCLFLVAIITHFIGIAQTSESFNNIPTATKSSYLKRNWTGDNNLSWTATDARTDQTITSKAICIRNGLVSCNAIPNGIKTLSFKHQQVFTGSKGALEVRINGVLIGTVKPTMTVATASFTGINVAGNFNLEIKQITSGLRISIDDIQWTSYTSGLCTTPSSQPGSLSFSAVTTTSMTVSFVPPVLSSDKYLAVISTNSTLGASPINGTNYVTNDNLGSGHIVYIGSNTSFNVTDLNPSITYYFYIFSVNSNCTGGPLYLTTNPATDNKKTATLPSCSAPTSQVSNVKFSAVTSNSINGTFVAAPDADGYLVCMSTNSSIGFTPTNGTSYAEGAIAGTGKVIKFGSGNTFNKNGLTPATTYYFTFFPINNFTCTGGPLYNNTGFRVNATTVAVGSTGIPAGYYDTVSTQTCAALKSVLKWRTTQDMTPRTYGALWNQYGISDVKTGEAATNVVTGTPYNYSTQSVIWDIYSDKPGPNNDPYEFTPMTAQCGNYSREADCYNREHSVPQSWFGGNASSGTAGTESDYHFIFPTDGKVNAVRNNYMYGEVTSPTFTSLNGSKLGPCAFPGITGTVFEPIDEYKGDLARAFFYFVTRYEDKMPLWSGGTEGKQAFDPTTFPSIDLPYLKMMLKWHYQDPVSQKEIDRNNAAYSFQGNRNPYIDHPEYVSLVWNNTCTGLSTLPPVDSISIAGKLNGDNIKLEWKVINESNSLQYDVERSINKIDFIKIGTVKPNNISQYLYNDENVSALGNHQLFYRLKKINSDGKWKYSNNVMLTSPIPPSLQFKVYPNPLTKNSVAKIQFRIPTINSTSFVLSDMTGKIYQQIFVPTGASSVSIDLKNTPAGLYLIKMVQIGNITTQKIQIL